MVNLAARVVDELELAVRADGLQAHPLGGVPVPLVEAAPRRLTFCNFFTKLVSLRNVGGLVLLCVETDLSKNNKSYEILILQKKC